MASNNIYPFSNLGLPKFDEKQKSVSQQGQYCDGDTGLINMNARLYDPVLGRFMTADPTIPNVYNPQSLNRYSYVLNNPFRYTDPTGYHPEALGEVTEEFGFWQDPNSPDDWIMFWDGEYTFGNDAFADVNGGYSGSLPDYSGVGEDFFIANDAFSGMSPFSGGLGAEASGGFADEAVISAYSGLFNARSPDQLKDAYECKGICHGILEMGKKNFLPDYVQRELAGYSLVGLATIPVSGGLAALTTSVRVIELGTKASMAVQALSIETRLTLMITASNPAVQQSAIQFSEGFFMEGPPPPTLPGIFGSASRKAFDKTIDIIGN